MRVGRPVGLFLLVLSGHLVGFMRDDRIHAGSGSGLDRFTRLEAAPSRHRKDLQERAARSSGTTWSVLVLGADASVDHGAQRWPSMMTGRFSASVQGVRLSVPTGSSRRESRHRAA